MGCGGLAGSVLVGDVEVVVNDVRVCLGAGADGDANAFWGEFDFDEDFSEGLDVVAGFTEGDDFSGDGDAGLEGGEGVVSASDEESLVVEVKDLAVVAGEDFAPVGLLDVTDDFLGDAPGDGEVGGFSDGADSEWDHAEEADHDGGDDAHGDHDFCEGEAARTSCTG